MGLASYLGELTCFKGLWPPKNLIRLIENIYSELRIAFREEASRWIYMVTGLEQARLLLLPLFILGLAFELKGEGGRIILCETVKKCSFSDDIHLMASLENHQRFLRENMTNKQKFRARVQHIEYKD